MGRYAYEITKIRREKSTPRFHRGNIVVRDVCDRGGNRLGAVIEPHDGTEAGAMAAAQRATDRMYAEFPDASNIQSCIGASDASGVPKWSISPNFQYLAEIGTDEARNIWGDEILEPCR